MLIPFTGKRGSVAGIVREEPDAGDLTKRGETWAKNPKPKLRILNWVGNPLQYAWGVISAPHFQ
jgi:hypothetical protein